jgi:hypothetical protein
MKIKSLLIAVLLLPVISLVAQKSFNPELKLKKGDGLKYEIAFDGNIVQSMGGQEMTIKLSGSSKNTLTVEQVMSNNDYHMAMKMTDINLSMTMPMMDTTMMISEVPGSPVIIINKYGKSLRKIDSTAKNQAGLGIDPASMGGASPFHQFAGKKIKAGEKWNIERNDTLPFMGGNIYNLNKIEYTLVGREKLDDVEFLKATYKGTIESKGSTTQQGMDFYIEGTGVVQGTVYFDEKRGVPVNEESTTENDMTLALSGQQNMTIPMSQKITLKRKLVQ